MDVPHLLPARASPETIRIMEQLTVELNNERRDTRAATKTTPRTQGGILAFAKGARSFYAHLHQSGAMLDEFIEANAINAHDRAMFANFGKSAMDVRLASSLVLIILCCTSLCFVLSFTIRSLARVCVAYRTDDT